MRLVDDQGIDLRALQRCIGFRCIGERTQHHHRPAQLAQQRWPLKPSAKRIADHLERQARPSAGVG